MNPNRDLKNIFELYKEKNGILQECLNISLLIKDEIEKNIEKNSEELPDIISGLVNKRDADIERMKNADLAINHYSLKLPVKEQKIIKEVKRASEAGIPISGILDFSEKTVISELCNLSDLSELSDLSVLSDADYVRVLYNIFEDNKIITKKIRYVDDSNSATIKSLMEKIKHRIKSIKGNRNLMSKFTDCR